MTRNRADYEEVGRRLLQGLNDCAVSRVSGVPRSTVRDWRRGLYNRTSRDRDVVAGTCPCLEKLPALPSAAYAYLLGLYLGDGCLSSAPRGVWRLRITLDVRYPGIIEDCAKAMEALMAGRHAYCLHRTGCVEVSMYSKHWICFFPQHGAGPKHHRRIELVPWQEAIVHKESEQFLRGLVQSDGCRVVTLDRRRLSTRYHFSNRSEDIRQLFCAALDRLRIGWTRPSQHTIAIYRKDAVERLDTFIGPKR